MSIYSLVPLAIADEAATTTQVPSGQVNAHANEPSLMANLMPLIAIMVVFYFLMIRPQQKRMREQQNMMKGLKKGDIVVTMGGMMGVVTDVSDDVYVALEIAKDVSVQFKRESVGEVIKDHHAKAHEAGKEHVAKKAKKANKHK